MAFDFKALHKNDQALLVTGAVTVLLTFFPAYAKASVKAKDSALGSIGGSEDRSAWVEWATIGTLLLIAAFVIVVLKLVVANVLPDGVPWNLVAAAAAALGTLILIIYVFTFGPDVPAIAEDSLEISTGPGWSGWLLLIAAIAFTVLAFLGFKSSGEKVPQAKRNDTTPPAQPRHDGPAAQTPPAQPTTPPAAPPTAPPAAPPAGSAGHDNPPAGPPAPPAV